MKIRPNRLNDVTILFLLIAKPSLKKCVKILFRIEFDDNGRDGFAILALILLSRHETHVRVNADTKTG